MLSILIVNWNTLELLRACLASLQIHLVGLVHEVIVVDCASLDNSAAMVEHEFPGVKLIASQRNLGFADGNNLAYSQARGEWIWLLNPDTEIFANAAGTLIDFLRANNNAGAVASALIDARNGTFQRSCRTFPTPSALWSEALLLSRFFPRSRRFGFYKMGEFNHRSRRDVEQPMASSFMLRRTAIESIGGLFDSQFPIYFNDVDLCWRLKQSGWRIWYEPRAHVRHWGGAATSQRKAAMIEESHASLERFYHKHFRAIISPFLFWLTMRMVKITGWARVWFVKRKAAPSG